MHGLRFGEGDLFDASATAVKSAAVILGMIALRLGARADINIRLLRGIYMHSTHPHTCRHEQKCGCQYDGSNCLH